MPRFSLPRLIRILSSGLISLALTSDIKAAQSISTAEVIREAFHVPELSSFGHAGLQEHDNLRLLAQQQQAKVALVIGNAAYEDDPLANPVNDATAIHQTLDELGFEVLPLVTNADKREMLEAIDNFYKRLEQGAVGVFYYAGHGVQVDGINYLVPLDATLEREAHAEFDAIPLNRVIREMDSAGTSFNILIVDACRDNPFYRQWRRTRGSNTRGLSVNHPPRGTLIAYATQPNDVAEDGYGNDHSPFTQALLNHLHTPNLNIRAMLDRVASDVFAATNELQFPWTEGGLIGDFSFNSGDNLSVGSAPKTDFLCQILDNQPTIVVEHPSRGVVPLIRWDDSDNHSSRPQIDHCFAVASRFQNLNQQQGLRYIVEGQFSGYPAICGFDEKPSEDNLISCEPENLLIILHPTEDPQNIIEQLIAINNNVSEREPVVLRYWNWQTEVLD